MHVRNRGEATVKYKSNACNVKKMAGQKSQKKIFIILFVVHLMYKSNGHWQLQTCSELEHELNKQVASTENVNRKLRH